MYRKIAFNFVGVLFLVLGSLAFLAGFWISNGSLNATKELPLGEFAGIVVSEDGRIYVGLRFYGKIQVYDSNGEFIENWSTDNYGGTFILNIEGDKIIVATARGNNLIKYDLEGHKLSVDILPRDYTDFTASKEFLDQNTGTKYSIRTGIFPKIVKSQNVEYEPIVEMSFLQKLFKGPLPAWLYIPFGMGIIFFTNLGFLIRKLKDGNQIP